MPTYTSFFSAVTTDTAGDWTSINNAKVLDGLVASANYPYGLPPLHDAHLAFSGSTFAIPITDVILGVLAEVLTSGVPDAGSSHPLICNLTKGGITLTPFSTTQYTIDGTLRWYGNGSSIDLWSTAFAPADFNSDLVGITTLPVGPSPSGVISVDSARITVYTSSAAVSTTTALLAASGMEHYPGINLRDLGITSGKK